MFFHLKKKHHLLSQSSTNSANATDIEELVVGETVRAVLFRGDCKEFNLNNVGKRTYTRVFIDVAQALTDYAWDQIAWTKNGVCLFTILVKGVIGL